ncbi:hypothetical protein CLU90_2085 [Janthinobacterium sp. 67]|uniref:CBASS cGAMP synthase n=1 Tax=Janthinobacterium sp. 67 TaxID=2035207 RepID=UPI000C239217|nr:hypothetical protein [Janthinobacterium sp. 67]PJJ18878.1 hypothetical protein CLU90_2085 [Janthinobacterium sp. 67]
MLNLSPLFYKSEGDDVTFLDNLNLSPARKAFIAAAKTEVRSCLRDGIPRVLRERGYNGEVPRPRFFTQGSWAYGTLNAPAKPTQQADVDDGCYLPLGFVSLTARPSMASSLFFAAAQEALVPLVKERGWRLITNKSTCIRIEISSDAHIDIPLYAIPDDEFLTLTKAALNAYGFDSVEEAMRQAEQDAWTRLPSNRVLLAHREEDWKESDPRPVKDWFLGEVKVRGEQFCRVVRYLKAFRDWQWTSGGPASILLMAVAAPLFERRTGRDDLALLDVLAQLPAALRAGVKNPAEENESLTDRLGAEGVEDAATHFEEFERFVRGAVNASSESLACTWLIEKLGSRFPYQPSRVLTVSVAATIAAAPAQVAASPLVGRTKAG